MLLSKLISILLTVLRSARPEWVGAGYEIDDLTDVLCNGTCPDYAPLERLVHRQSPGAILLFVEVWGAPKLLLCLST